VEVVRRSRELQAEVHVVVTGDEELQRLNRAYRKVDRPTDVLSFPDGDPLPDGELLLGEIVISLDAARRQAAELGHSELRELEELVLHGTLHLLGHDHERDNGEMEDLELRLREELLG
jgi:probable rRNA maturation factor